MLFGLLFETMSRITNFGKRILPKVLRSTSNVPKRTFCLPSGARVIKSAKDQKVFIVPDDDHEEIARLTAKHGSDCVFVYIPDPYAKLWMYDEIMEKELDKE